MTTNNLSKKAIKEILSWVNGQVCDCVDDMDSFSKCCGSHLNILEYLKEVYSKDKIEPKFKNLSQDEQKNVILGLENIAKENGKQLRKIFFMD